MPPLAAARVQTPGLEACASQIDEIFEQFKEYKRSVPVRCDRSQCRELSEELDNG